MSHIFLSYASDDRVVADAVCAGLETRGIPCWIAPRDVAPGSQWDQAILHAIDEADAFLLILSRASNESPFVANEANRAFAKKKAIYTFRVEDVLPAGSLEFYLARHHWMDGFPAPIAPHVDRLIAAIGLTRAGAPAAVAVAAMPAAASAVIAVPVAADPRAGVTDAAAARSMSATAPAAAAAASRRTTRSVMMALAAGVGVMAVIGAAYLVGARRSTPSAPAAPAFSLDKLQVVQLTTSGNAERPAISPDGKFVAYIQRDGNATSLWVRQTATPSNVQIVPAQPGVTIWAATVTPDGQFVDFIREEQGHAREAWRVPFLGGAPRKLLENIESAIGWSADGQQMAFVRSAGQDKFVLIVADRTGAHARAVATSQQPQWFLNLRQAGGTSNRPSWDERGSSVALWRGSSARVSAPVVVDVSTGKVTMVGTTDLGIPTDGSVLWLTDSTLMIHVGRSGQLGGQLGLVDRHSGTRTRITNDINSYAGLSASADRSLVATARRDQRVGLWIGNADASDTVTEIVTPAPFSRGLVGFTIGWAGIDRLAYNGTLPDGTDSIFSLRLGEIPTMVAQDAAVMAVSSDGKVVVFRRTEGGLAGTDVTGRTVSPIVDTPNATAPTITPDNSGLLFVSADTGRQSAWLVPLSGGAPREMSRIRVLLPGVDMRASSAGTSLVFASSDLQRTRFIVTCDLPDCANPKTIDTPPTVRRVRWTPDGKGIAYIDAATERNIWLQPLAGGPPRQLTRFTDKVIADFAWSHDGKKLAIARATVTNDIVLFKGLK